MKFLSKLLKQAGTVVYVLFESDRPINDKNPGNPIGVVSSEEKTKLFYGQDSKHRNYFIFNLDEVPEQTGVPGNPIPPPAPAAMDDTRKRVEETTQKMQRLLEEMRTKKKKGV